MMRIFPKPIAVSKRNAGLPNPPAPTTAIVVFIIDFI